jgi:hypothetical protein
MLIAYKRGNLTISVQCYKSVENGKNDVTLHLNERLHLHVGKDPMLVCVSLDMQNLENLLTLRIYR